MTIPSITAVPTGHAARAILLPKEAAHRLSVTPAMLRKLTERGEIGHVRLGTGEQRCRVGYTESQITDFIAARTVHPAPPADNQFEKAPARRRARRAARPRNDVSDVAAGLVKAAISSGLAAEWGSQ